MSSRKPGRLVSQGPSLNIVKPRKCIIHEPPITYVTHSHTIGYWNGHPRVTRERISDEAKERVSRRLEYEAYRTITSGDRGVQLYMIIRCLLTTDRVSRVVVRLNVRVREWLAQAGNDRLDLERGLVHHGIGKDVASGDVNRLSEQIVLKNDEAVVDTSRVADDVSPVVQNLWVDVMRPPAILKSGYRRS